MQANRTYRISARTGTAIVIANMIGTGVFTSLGFQLRDLENAAAVLTLWVLGGVLALSGAFSYAEVGTHIRKSGGEYTFLSEIFYPVVGYLSGWISLTVGFAAPIALSAIAVVEYFPFGTVPTRWVSVLLVAAITAVHSRTLKTSVIFQDVSTLFKVLLIGVLILVGLVLPGQAEARYGMGADYVTELTSSGFAIALIFVSYSYSGWNAAAYITEEFHNPARSLPIALIGGTLIVTVMYTALQYVFLKHVPAAELVGQIEVGNIAVRKMLGAGAGNVFGVAISLLLVSGISAMTWVGPRVTARMADGHRLWQVFRARADGIPHRALWLQFGITALLLLTGTFEQILVYCGVLLTISAMLTVVGVFVIRARPEPPEPGSFRSPLFPLFQILFVLLSLWMIAFAFLNNTVETVAGLSNLLLGLVTWFLSNRMNADHQRGRSAS